MNRPASQSSFGIVGLLAAVALVCVALATYVFLSGDATPDEPEASAGASGGDARPVRSQHPERTGVAGHDPGQQEGPDDASRLAEQRRAFLRKLAKQAPRDAQKSTQEPGDDAPPPRRPDEGARETTTEELHERWAEDSPDPEWTDEMSQLTSSLLDVHDIDGSVSNVDCRTRVCRIDFHFADLNEAMKLAQEAKPQLGPHWNTQSHVDKEVSIRVLVDQERR